MKRVLFLLAMALLVFGVVKAQVTFPEFSTGTSDIKYYRIKNMRSGKYASYQTDSKVMLQTANTDMRTLFYFKDASGNLPDGVTLEDGVKAVYIFNAATPTRLNNIDASWTYNGNIYYIREHSNNYTGVVISTSQDVSKYGAWNDYYQTTICNYVANDGGSIWEFESADVSNPLTLIPEVVMSTEETKKYYTIRNIDCNKYAEGQAENEAIKLESNRSFGCWKFVEASPQDALGQGVKACYIYNVNLGKYLNEFYSSEVATYSETTEGATVYYLTPVNKTYNIYSYNGWFISKSKNIGDYSGWNRQGPSTKVGNWNCDHGSVFDISELYTFEEYNLISKKSTVIVNEYAHHSSADYYALPADEVNALGTAIDNSDIVENGDIEHNYKELDKLVEARNLLASSASDKTGAPTSGDFIRLLNRNYNKYLNHTSEEATSFNAVTDKNNNTLWQLIGDEANGFSLKNVATGNYIGSQEATSNAFPVSDAEVKFDFSNPAECYAAFRVHGAKNDRAYAHIDGYGKLVCWENGAVASQWAVSVEVSLQEVLDAYNSLKELYDAKSSQINLPMAETFFDTYASAPTTATFYTDLIAMGKQMEAIRSLKPGYYYIRSYSNGQYVNCTKKDDAKVKTQVGADNNAIFYLDSDNNLMAYENGAYWKNVYRLGVGSFTSNSTSYTYKHPWTIAIGNYDGTFSLQYGNDAEGRYYATANNNETDHAGTATSDAAMWYLDPVESLPLSVSDVKYATFASAVDVIIPEGVKVYYAPATSSESTIQLVEVKGNIPANTGVIVYAETAKEYNFNITSGVSALGTNYLMPAVEAQSITPQTGYSAYIFANKNNTNGVGFYRLNSGSNVISGHKCWLELPTSISSNSFFGFGFDEDDLTAVDSVDLIVSDDNNIVYDLQGNVVVNTVKGRLYIKNGRVFKAN